MNMTVEDGLPARGAAVDPDAEASDRAVAFA